MGSFEAHLKFGAVGEQWISRWLQSRGNLVFPAYEVEQATGKGPRLFAATGNLILPDLLSINEGKICWVEAKHKTCFTWHRISSQWVTGIDLRHYEDYRKVSERTGLPVWLMFYHPEPTPSDGDIAHGCPARSPVGLFGGEIRALEKIENHRSDKWGRSGMVYWARPNLAFIADVNGVSPRIEEASHLGIHAVEKPVEDWPERVEYREQSAFPWK